MKDFKILHRMDELYTEEPIIGYMKRWKKLKREGFDIGSDIVRKFRQTLGLNAIMATKRIKDHKIYPFLLKIWE